MFNIKFQKLKSTLPRPNSSTPNSNRQPSLSFKRWENLILFLKLNCFFSDLEWLGIKEGVQFTGLGKD